MVELKAYHRAPWKRDVVLFTSILRLRCQPPPPYKIIAELLLKTWPEAMRKLAKNVVSRETQPEMLASESRTKEWLAQYLQERYELAEEWGSEPWTTARDKDRSMVEEILRVTGLKEMGYEVMDKEEMRLQMKWKREGDWRYCSTPEPFQTSSIPPRDISKLIVAHSEPQVPTFTKVAREIFQVLNSTGHNNSLQERNTSMYQTLKDIAKRIEVMSMVETELEGNDRAGGGLTQTRKIYVSM